MISESVFEGIKLGLLLSMMIGPVFFALLTTSLDHGFRQAAILALGVFFSDLVYVVLSYLGVHLLSQIPSAERYLGIVGGLILLGFGINFIVKKVPLPDPDKVVPLPKKRKAFLKGFGINGINPFVLLFWLSIEPSLQNRIADPWVISKTSHEQPYHDEVCHFHTVDISSTKLIYHEQSLQLPPSHPAMSE
jgi:threonine/homoserine/homoserine lactone efflux protein